jgi:hypothetical protein
MKLNFGALQRVSGVALVAGLFAGCGGDSSNGVTIAGGPQVKTCTASQECNPGQVCGPTGTCTDVLTGGGGSSGGAGAQPPPGTGVGNTTNIPITPQGGGGGVGGGCASANVMFKQETPNVMLIVDRSLSMDEDFGTASRWDTVRTALTDPAMGLLPVLETQVRFGLTMYTSPGPMGGFPVPPRGGRNGGGGGDGGASGGLGGSPSAGGSGGAAPTSCPVLVEVPIALNNFAPIQTVYAATEPLGSTPTGESVAAIWPKIQALDPVTFPGPRVMVLATDGDPNMCGNDNARNEGRRASEAAIQAAYEAGIPTFVISVGNDVTEEHLRRIANLGQGFPVTDMMNRFYPANDPSQLADAFETIISGVRACVFDLNGKVNLNAATMGRVTIDGMNLTYMDPNGWHLNGQGQVVVDGSACQQIQQGATGVDIWFPCGAFVPE